MVKKRGALITGGGLVGIVNGLLGGGGGMIAVPLLQKCAALPSKEAHATAIAVILPASVFSGIVYLFRGFISLAYLLPVALGVALGGILGARLLARLNVQKVNFIFALLMLAAGVRMLF